MKKFLILAIAVLAMLAVSVPALAVSPSTYTFQMAARMLTDIGWWQRSSDISSVHNGSDDVGTWFLTLPGHSYLRGRFYSVDKNVGGRIELGLASVQPSATVSLRYAYGYWRVGNCRILAGQTDNWFGSLAYHPRQYVGLQQDAHLLLFGWGLLWPHRVPQVQFTYNTDKWGVQFALEEPRQKTNYFGANTDATFLFPRASLTFMFKYGGFMTHPGVNFVHHTYEAGNTGSFDESYNTWALVLPIKYTIGAFTLKFQGHYGVNFATEYPFYPVELTRPYRNGITSGDIDDTTIFGGFLAGEYKIGKIMITGGVGYENFSNDAWSGKNGYNKDENVRMSAFIAVPYQFTKNFGIHPEFSYYSHGDDPQTGDDKGNEWLLGVQFRFVF